MNNSNTLFLNETELSQKQILPKYVKWYFLRPQLIVGAVTLAVLTIVYFLHVAPTISMPIVLLYLWYRDFQKEKVWLKRVNIQEFEGSGILTGRLIKFANYCRITKNKNKQWDDRHILEYSLGYLQREQPAWWADKIKQTSELSANNLDKLAEHCVQVHKKYPEESDERIINYANKTISN